MKVHDDGIHFGVGYCSHVPVRADTGRLERASVNAPVLRVHQVDDHIGLEVEEKLVSTIQTRDSQQAREATYVESVVHSHLPKCHGCCPQATYLDVHEYP